MDYSHRLTPKQTDGNPILVNQMQPTQTAAFGGMCLITGGLGTVIVTKEGMAEIVAMPILTISDNARTKMAAGKNLLLDL